MDDFKPEDVAWIILFLPLLAAVVITLFTQRDAKFSSQLSITAVVLCFVLSGGLFLMFRDLKHVPTTALTWLNIGDLKIDLGLRLDPLSMLMLLVVTGVGADVPQLV